MAVTEVKCPKCSKTEVIKHGTSKSGKQRYYCKNAECAEKTFRMEYQSNGCKAGVEKQIIKMAVNASGIRDTARVLEISQYKVMSTLKKQKRQYRE